MTEDKEPEDTEMGIEETESLTALAKKLHEDGLIERPDLGAAMTVVMENFAKIVENATEDERDQFFNDSPEKMVKYAIDAYKNKAEGPAGESHSLSKYIEAVSGE